MEREVKSELEEHQKESGHVGVTIIESLENYVRFNYIVPINQYKLHRI